MNCDDPIWIPSRVRCVLLIIISTSSRRIRLKELTLIILEHEIKSLYASTIYTTQWRQLNQMSNGDGCWLRNRERNPDWNFDAVCYMSSKMYNNCGNILRATHMLFVIMRKLYVVLAFCTRVGPLVFFYLFLNISKCCFFYIKYVLFYYELYISFLLFVYLLK